MDIERGNLDILFRRIPCEYITLNQLNEKERHDCFHVNKQYYLGQCHQVFSGRSEDERNYCYDYLKETMHKKGEYPSSVFQLILDAAEQFLTYQTGSVLCKFEELLRWREISLSLGQDFFVCAYLANRDLQWRQTRQNFSWMPILMSNNPRVRAVLKRGIAENHFHLKGSSRIFEVNWICLMNHICGREREFCKIDKGMQKNGVYEKHYGYKLYQKCQRAALYRLYLFYTLRGKKLPLICLDDLLTGKKRLDICLSDMQDAIGCAQADYGASLASPMKSHHEGFSNDNASYVLDYAFRKEFFDFNQNSHRILAGERSFLYDCFQSCFAGTFSELQQNLFYRYLKLQIIFRQELVQGNQEVGFKNFNDYEGRKEYFIENHPRYMNEFLAMAIKGQLEREYLQSLEMRITPKTSSGATAKMLKKYNSVDIPLAWDANKRLRYVMHFPKSGDAPKGNKQRESFPSVRNIKCRIESRQRARALVKLMKSHSRLRLGIVGIDACASEIGCRPETFGQIFRYLRHVDFHAEYTDFCCRVGTAAQPQQLAITYHAGEDFSDIVDGLRAIDEAILFCGLDRGSRIGHALALGIEPSDYYKTKAYRLLLPKQDFMDDIAWMLYMADAHGCSVDACLRTELLQTFRKLFQEVYRSCCQCDTLPGLSVLDYCQSWMLRGDDPELYRLDWPEFIRKVERKGREIEPWERFAFNTSSEIPDKLREVKMYYQLNRCYAFDPDAREHGKKMESFKVEPAYISLVRQLQDCMIRKLAKKGISVETNPSSNYLIGTIHRYDQHPILRFNSRKLADVDPNMSLSVSLNTDDQGVFDTLLENEYALMVLALEKAKDEAGHPRYDIEDIYEWLDYVREMGLEQVFDKYT